MGGITNETVHLSFAADWSKEVNPLLRAEKFSPCTALELSEKCSPILKEYCLQAGGESFYIGSPALFLKLDELPL